MQDLPTFESQEPPPETPAPPKKPRQKPTRKRKARKLRAVEPASNAFPKKRRAKKRRIKIAPTKTVIHSDEPSMFTAFRHITDILAPFSKVARQELLQTVGDIVKETK